MRILLLATVLFLQHACYSQIDLKKLDSLARSIDSSQKASRSWQDSFNKKQDSIYRAAQIKQDAQTNNRNDARVIAQKEINANQKQQAIIKILIGLLFAILLIVALMRRRS